MAFGAPHNRNHTDERLAGQRGSQFGARTLRRKHFQIDPCRYRTDAIGIEMKKLAQIVGDFWARRQNMIGEVRINVPADPRVRNRHIKMTGPDDERHPRHPSGETGQPRIP